MRRRNPFSRAAAKFRGTVRRAYYRSPVVRKSVSAVRWPVERGEAVPGALGSEESAAPDISHLSIFSEVADGPVQREEALFLYSLLRVVRPRTVVEIGFLNGRSALNFLCALDADARLYSFDIDERCTPVANDLFAHDPRFTFRVRSQAELTPDDIDGREADFVFLDASHELDLNRSTFRRLLSLMAPNAILAVHDTGTVPRHFVVSGHYWHESGTGWIDDEREVMPDERAFLNWLLDEHPEFSQVHFHSRRTVRCGITVLQRSAPLIRPREPNRVTSG
jgi:predicted O-methyltransferase YrrM